MESFGNLYNSDTRPERASRQIKPLKNNVVLNFNYGVGGITQDRDRLNVSRALRITKMRVIMYFAQYSGLLSTAKIGPSTHS